MFCLVTVFTLILEAAASQIFSETVGKVIVKQNSCSVVPHGVWKRFDSHGQKQLKEFPPEALKFLMTWVHSEHGVESRLENMLLKWDEQSICFNRSSTITLKKVAHGGKFSDDMNSFTYLEVPEFWVAEKEDDSDTWKNVKLEECSTTDGLTFACSESAFQDSCSQKTLEKCSERIEMDSSLEFFTFTRRLGGSHLVATRARKGTIIRNGNVFEIEPVDIPKSIFMITLARNDVMSIGASLLKN